MNRILGVDSGINGACALYLIDGGSLPPDAIFDLPTVGEGNKREIDYARMRDKIWALQPDVAFIEVVNAFLPKRTDPETGEKETINFGATSMFRFGGAYYAARAVICCLGIPLRSVGSPEWKAGFGLRGGKSNKDDSRKLVMQRYPQTAPYVSLVKHGNRAEAWLIGAYGARKMRREGENLDIPE